MIIFKDNKFLNVNLFFWFFFLLSSLAFVLWPEIDIYFTSLFYNGEKFPLNNTLFDNIFYYSVKPLILTLSLLSLALFLYNFFRKKNILNINTTVILYIFLFLSVAPGLIVNATLKEHLGRARPAQTTYFGGDKEFTPAFILSDQKGYSFSSGHSAAAFSLIGFALLARKRRKIWLTLSLSYGILVSLARISVGGHFLSDTVTSFFIVYISTYFFYGLVVDNKKRTRD
ncbi:MAG: phosphatase PAP2 family protein [Campylobacterota bacterium]|nr:phosphatase PAP2 family protein [Campylobacterota bacterium]